MEQDRAAYEHLSKFCADVQDVEAEPLQGDFTQRIHEIKAFLERHGKPFPFFFIDPTGWKPIRISSIKPILELRPGEVLINFMTSHIRRFLKLESLDFDALFGTGQTQEIAGLHGQERDEAAVFAYASEVKKAGKYEYICTTVVPNPLKQQAHFHLIYATRNWKGVEKFKEVEKAALRFAGDARTRARERERERRTSQPAFDFGANQESREKYLDNLRTRFLQLAADRVLEEINSGRPNSYHSLEAMYVRRPLVFQSDFRQLLTALRERGVIHIEGATGSLKGISPNARVRKS